MVQKMIVTLSLTAITGVTHAAARDSLARAYFEECMRHAREADGADDMNSDLLSYIIDVKNRRVVKQCTRETAARLNRSGESSKR